MNRKRTKIGSILTGGLYAVLVVALCPCPQMTAAQTFQQEDENAEDKDIMGLPDPFSLPPLLKRMLEDMDRKIREEEAERARKKALQDAAAAAKKTATKPVEAPVALPQLPVLTLSGIIFGEKTSQAIINGEVFSAGDIIRFPAGEAHVAAIEKNKVIVEFLDEQHVLSVDTDGKDKKPDGTANKKPVKNK